MMARTIEATGKTIEDALRAALSELGVDKSDVTYEVIEEPRKGILGLIGTRSAKIIVTLKETPTIETPAFVMKTVDELPKAEKSDVEKPIVETVEKPSDENSIDEESGNETAVSEMSNREEAQSDEEEFDPASTLERAKSFLHDVFDKMKLNVEIDEQETEDGFMLNIKGGNLGILIGKHGQTLDALQYIVNLAANNGQARRIHFIIDVEGYRAKRTESLKSLAKSLAERAIKIRKEVRLEPMTRYERKVIHLTLQDNPRVSTHSTGSEPYRYIIITPKKPGSK